MTATTAKNMQMVDLQGQYQRVKKEIDEQIARVLESSAYINGSPVAEFASDLERYLDVAHVIPCGNGTDALQLALMSLNLQAGDEVITVGATFVATAEAIALVGCKPVFVDICPRNFTMDAKQLEEAITPRTRCIIPVHLYGQCAPMEEILQIAWKHKLYVIEDNAQAIGAEYRFSGGELKKSGTMGDIGCTSFYPSKNLGCYGDGGAVFTNNPDLAEKIGMLGNHGQRSKYDSEHIGINSRLDSIQAAVLKVKLQYLDGYNNKRRLAADFYDQAFGKHAQLTIPERAGYSSHVFHQYTLVVDGNRDNLKGHLSKHGIPSMVYYPIPVHLQTAYRHLGYAAGDLPVTERMAAQTISLPMHTELTVDDLKRVTDAVLGFFGKAD